MDPITLSAFAPLVSAGLNAASEISRPARQYKWNKRAAEDANRMNRENQQWLLQQQRDIQNEQRIYDSPQNQMKRFKEAGLNPHLIYGNGTTAGQVFPINAPGVPGVNIGAPEAANPDIMGSFMAASRSIASLGLTEAKTQESLIKSQAIAIQNEISRTNPMLKPSVANAVSRAMEEAARLKETESYLWQSQNVQAGRSNISIKIDNEVEALNQKLGLNTSDLQIRNRILESKEYENAIKELQVKWLKDSQVTPEHIRQGLMLILSKMLGR